MYVCICMNELMYVCIEITYYALLFALIYFIIILLDSVQTWDCVPETVFL